MTNSIYLPHKDEGWSHMVASLLLQALGWVYIIVSILIPLKWHVWAATLKLEIPCQHKSQNLGQVQNIMPCINACTELPAENRFREEPLMIWGKDSDKSGKKLNCLLRRERNLSAGWPEKKTQHKFSARGPQMINGPSLMFVANNKFSKCFQVIILGSKVTIGQWPIGHKQSSGTSRKRSPDGP